MGDVHSEVESRRCAPCQLGHILLDIYCQLRGREHHSVLEGSPEGESNLHGVYLELREHGRKLIAHDLTCPGDCLALPYDDLSTLYGRRYADALKLSHDRARCKARGTFTHHNIPRSSHSPLDGCWRLACFEHPVELEWIKPREHEHRLLFQILLELGILSSQFIQRP